MQIHLPLNGTGTVPQRLYRDLRSALAEGRLTPGERLPPSRALAAELGIARQAVVDTYERLVAEGFFEARRGPEPLSAGCRRWWTANRRNRE